MKKIIIKPGGHILFLMIFVLMVFVIPPSIALVALISGAISVNSIRKLLIFPFFGYWIYFTVVYIKSWKISLDERYLTNSEPKTWNQILPKFITTKILINNVEKITICRVKSLDSIRKKEHRKGIVLRFDPVMLVELKSGKSYLFRIKPFSTKGVRNLTQEFKNRGIEVITKDNLI